MKTNSPVAFNFTLPFGRVVLLGLALAVAAILFGAMMGIVFGLNEDAIKNELKSSAMVVRESVYHGDDAAIKTLLDKSWSYMKRAHLHGGAMGTTAVVLILLLALLQVPQILISLCSLGLGAGSLGYSVFWMIAGFRAPTLGSTGAAKESLAWLAMPTSGAFVLSIVSVLGAVLWCVFTRIRHTK